jgi:hypothetical protein
LVCNATKDKNLMPNGKMEWLSEQRTMHSPPWSTQDFRNAQNKKNHVRDDVGEKMIMKFVWNVFLKLIYSLFCKIHKRGNTSHHM